MSNPPPIRLAYLGNSERNPVFWAWDAVDVDGNEYYVTYRHGSLAVTGPDLSVERQVGGEDDSAASRDDILAMTADLFDAEIIATGERCVCGMAYALDAGPERCLRCGERLRERRVVRLKRADHTAPGWLRDHMMSRFVAWRGHDEYGAAVWIAWSHDELVVFGKDSASSTDELYQLQIALPTPLPGEGAAVLPTLLSVELAGRLELELDAESRAAAGTAPEAPRRVFGHAVEVLWERGGSDTLLYPTRETAEDAAQRYGVDNPESVRAAAYVGRRVDWGYLLSFGWLRL